MWRRGGAADAACSEATIRRPREPESTAPFPPRAVTALEMAVDTEEWTAGRDEEEGADDDDDNFDEEEEEAKKGDVRFRRWERWRRCGR